MNSPIRSLNASSTIIVNTNIRVEVLLRVYRRCDKRLLLDPTHYKRVKSSRLYAITCLECSRKSDIALKKRGLKRKVLGEMDLNIATNRPYKQPRLAARPNTLR